MATFLGNAARRTTVFQFCCFVAVLAVTLPTAMTFGQEAEPQQPVQQLQEEELQQEFKKTETEGTETKEPAPETKKAIQEANEVIADESSASSNAKAIPAEPAAAAPQQKKQVSTEAPPQKRDVVTEDERPASSKADMSAGAAAMSGQFLGGPLSPAWLTVFLCTVMAVVLIMFFLLAGAGATVMALLWNSPDRQQNPVGYTQPSWRQFTHSPFRWRTGNAERFFGLNFDPRAWNPLRIARSVAQGAKQRLAPFVPSRRTAMRLACLALGVGLMIASGFCIVHGQTWIGLVLMASGYALVVLVWLWPWTRGSATSKELRSVPKPQNRPMPLAQALPSSVVTVEQTPINPINQELFAPVEIVGRSTATCWNYVDCEQSQPKQAPVEFTRKLRCEPCGKQYNVRGQGTLATRLIPCPKCNRALQRVGGALPTKVTDDPEWSPIISVLCKGCRRLIDVPYASRGKVISCPGCRADLPVPNTEL